MSVFGWFVVIAIVVNIFKAIAKGAEEAKGSAPSPGPIRPKGRPPQQTGLPKGPPPRARIERQPTVPVPRQKGPEELWREMLGQMQQAEQARRSGKIRVEEVEGWEETQSLEVEEQVRSLEGPVERKARVRVDYDEQAESVAQRRVATAAARDGAITPADHKTFDEQIRTPGAPVVLQRGREEIRRAMIWREILGPPVSMR